MSGSIKLQRRQATVHIWFMVGSIQIQCNLNLNFSMRATIRSIWILTEAIVWLITTSSLSNCSLPARNAGMFTLTPSRSSSVLQIFPATKLFSDFLWAKMMFTHLSVFSHNKSVSVILSLYSQKPTIFNFGFQRERKNEIRVLFPWLP